LTLDYGQGLKLAAVIPLTPASMKIGQLAKQAATPIDTVRYYERHGLLPEPQRRASGYRDYTHDDVRRLRFVRRAKALGFSLTEIRELLDLSSQPERDMADMKAAAAVKLADVEAKLAELTRIRDGLQTLVAACPGHGNVGECPILNALAEDGP
jgi:MerR family copper efflux transcriptional regulator